MEEYNKQGNEIVKDAFESTKQPFLQEKVVCSKCGATLEEGQEFCPKCGTPKNKPASNVCSKCGATLEEGQEFCPKCGQKAGLVVDNNVASAINQFNSGIDKQNAKKKKTPIIIAVVLIAIVALAVGAKTLGPKIFVSVDELCAEGNYQKAYDKADEKEKEQVLVENLAAHYSADVSDSLKDPSSFELRAAYYLEEKQYLVLQVGGANSYGAKVTNYWYYRYSEDEGEFSLWTSISDMDAEEYSEYDDDDEWIEKLLNNSARDDIRETIKSGVELKKAGVKRVNKLFEDDKLDDIDVIDVEFKVPETEKSDD